MCQDICNAVAVQEHNHEFLGSVMIGFPTGHHNHRFAGTTGPVIPYCDSHVHVFSVNSDFFFNHSHQIEGTT